MPIAMRKASFKNIHKFLKPYVVEDGRKFRLKDHDSGDTHHLNFEDKPEAKRWLEQGVALLSEMQDMLFAQSNWGLLLIFQAMDAAGKDGTIKHVMSGINSAGCRHLLLQAALCRGNRPRSSVAHELLPSPARENRHFQPVLL